MNNPTQEEDPQNACEDEEQDGWEQATLNELSKAGNEEAGECCQDIAKRPSEKSP